MRVLNQWDRATLIWSGVFVAAVGVMAAGAVWFPDGLRSTVEFVLGGFVEVAPLVIPGIVLSAWVMASGAGGRIADAFEGNVMRTVVVASAIGAVTPVCGVTVLPLMAGLLASGVPLAPVMAFWLSSPVTDPAMLATTAATLGAGFAVGKTVSAFGLGLLGGSVTAGLASRTWTHAPLRDNGLVGSLTATCGCGPTSFTARIWQEPERMQHFRRALYTTARLILICLTPAFAAEHLLNQVLEPEALTVYVGADAWWAVPLAVFVGAPAYLDGYAALPLTRGLIDHGMAPGAAMGFLVSGGVISVWGAMAIFPVIRLKPFLLYLVLALTGSLMAGWAYGVVG